MAPASHKPHQTHLCTLSFFHCICHCVVWISEPTRSAQLFSQRAGRGMAAAQVELPPYSCHCEFGWQASGSHPCLAPSRLRVPARGSAASPFAFCSLLCFHSPGDESLSISHTEHCDGSKVLLKQSFCAETHLGHALSF